MKPKRRSLFLFIGPWVPGRWRPCPDKLHEQLDRPGAMASILAQKGIRVQIVDGHILFDDVFRDLVQGLSGYGMQAGGREILYSPFGLQIPYLWLAGLF